MGLIVESTGFLSQNKLKKKLKDIWSLRVLKGASLLLAISSSMLMKSSDKQVLKSGTKLSCFLARTDKKYDLSAVWLGSVGSR